MASLPSYHQPATTLRRTAYLDGIRGLAAFLVFIHHYLSAFDVGAHEHGFGEGGRFYFFSSFPFIRIFFGGGDAAVAIFFVLSGLILAQSPLKAVIRDESMKGVRRSLLSSVIRRPFRLYLPAVCVALLTACAMHLPYGPHKITFITPQKTLLREISNCAIESWRYFNPFQVHDNAHWYQYGLHMWTLPIELKGSMLIFGIAFLGSLAPRRVNWLMIGNSILAVALLLSGRWTMACFTAGLLLSYNNITCVDAVLIDRLSKRGRLLFYSTLFVLGYWLLCEPNVFNYPKSASTTPGWKTLYKWTPHCYDSSMFYRFWHSIGAIVFIYAASRLNWIQKFFSARFFQYLGYVSFMLYLTHLPIVHTFGDTLRCTIGGCHLPVGSEPPWYQNAYVIPDLGPAGLSTRWLVAATIMTAICLPIGHIATIWINDPCVTFSKKLTTMLGLEKKIDRNTHSEIEQRSKDDT